MTLMKLRGKATIDDLLRMPKDGRKYELVDGEILVSPAGHAQFGAQDTITAEPTLPGFSCLVSRFFQ
jgi:hypothetical protein